MLKDFVEDDQFGFLINFLCFSVDIDDMPEVSSGIGGRRSSHSTAKKVSHVSHTSRICALTYSPPPLSLSLTQLFHEEMVLQWIVVHPLSKPLVLKNAWFFFEVLVCVSDQILILIVISLLFLSLSLFLQIKSMAQHLSNLGKLNSQRAERFSSKFMEDLDTLVGSVAMEICNKHVQVYMYTTLLCVTSLEVT